MSDCNTIRAAAALGLATFVSLGAQAAPFTEIRIGDEDGFGYGTGAASCPGATACTAANGSSANVGTGGVLGAETLPTVGDFLPDLDGNGTTATGSNDDFDNRAGEGISGTGFTDTGTSGAEFTDIALSTSYDASSAAEEVYNANTGTFGSGGPFPEPPSSIRSNQPGFSFRFDVDEDDINPIQPIFFNVIFGDFDVTPFDLELTFNDGSAGPGSTATIAITPQNNAEGEDGLIQASFAELEFSDVFSADGGGIFNGFLDVTFDAPSEPYTAYDFVELSTRPITTNVPAPGTLLLLACGILAASLTARIRSR